MISSMTPGASSTHRAWAHPVVVDGLGVGRPLGLVGGGQTPRQRQAPDGGEVGPAGPQQVESVALVLGDGLLVGQDVAPGRLAPERADDPGGADPPPGSVIR